MADIITITRFSNGWIVARNDRDLSTPFTMGGVLEAVSILLMQQIDMLKLDKETVDG